MHDRRPLAFAVAGALVAALVWSLVGGADQAPRRAEVPVGPGPAQAAASPRAAAVRSAAGTAPTFERVAVEAGPLPGTADGADGAPGPILVTGRVVDERGTPIAGAVVDVFETAADGDVTTFSFGGLEPRGSGFRIEPGTFRLPKAADGDGAIELRLVLEAETFAWSGSGTRVLVGDRGLGGSMRLGKGAEAIQFLPVPERWVAETDDEGRFEVRGADAAAPLSIRASARLHLDGHAEAAAPGADVVVTCRRGAVLQSELRLPGWLPPDAVELSLTAVEDGSTAISKPMFPTDGGAATANEVVAVSRFSSRVRVVSDVVAAGTHELLVRVRGMPEPVWRVPDLSLAIGTAQPDTRGTRIDLTHAVHRFVVRAVDAAQRPLVGLESPLLARVGGADGTEWTAFPWREGTAEVFGPRPFLDVVAFAPGYRRRELRLGAGETHLTFQALPRVQVVLPGLRALCGADRRVRVSMVRHGSTGLPGGITGVDPRSGATEAFQRWHLGVSGGAWLGAGDVVEVPLVLSGRYDVIVRVQRDDDRGETSVEVAEVDVSFETDAAPRVPVTLDPDAIRAALGRLDGR